MNASLSATEAPLLERAREGDREAFDALVESSASRLRSVVRRMIGHPEDTDDVVQDALLRAWQGLGSFRAGSSFSTWLCAIGSRAAIDHLRQRKRWRERAQVAYANACGSSPALGGEVHAALGAPDAVFDAEEHVAYCFTCVGRSLEPEEQASLVLREVMGFSGREAAEALGVSEPVFRHRLKSARGRMRSAFDGLCSLVNKQGVCYQCEGLRSATPEARRRGGVPDVASLEDRLACVRRADVDRGASQPLHDLFWRRTRGVEEEGTVPDTPRTTCGGR